MPDQDRPRRPVPAWVTAPPAGSAPSSVPVADGLEARPTPATHAPRADVVGPGGTLPAAQAPATLVEDAVVVPDYPPQEDLLPPAPTSPAVHTLPFDRASVVPGPGAPAPAAPAPVSPVDLAPPVPAAPVAAPVPAVPAVPGVGQPRFSVPGLEHVVVEGSEPEQSGPIGYRTPAWFARQQGVRATAAPVTAAAPHAGAGTGTAGASAAPHVGHGAAPAASAAPGSSAGHPAVPSASAAPGVAPAPTAGGAVTAPGTVSAPGVAPAPTAGASTASGLASTPTARTAGLPSAPTAAGAGAGAGAFTAPGRVSTLTATDAASATGGATAPAEGGAAPSTEAAIPAGGAPRLHADTDRAPDATDAPDARRRWSVGPTPAAVLGAVAGLLTIGLAAWWFTVPSTVHGVGLALGVLGTALSVVTLRDRSTTWQRPVALLGAVLGGLGTLVLLWAVASALLPLAGVTLPDLTGTGTTPTLAP